MNTTEAAATAKVTIATIRTWCRQGVITATKQAGRWIIDPTSLKQRINLGRTLRRAAATRRAQAIRNRIRTAIQLPTLTGSPKQIAWANSIRDRAITAALDGINITRTGIAYRLLPGGGYLAPAAGRHATETNCITALNTALANGTTAAWWINGR